MNTSRRLFLTGASALAVAFAAGAASAQDAVDGILKASGQGGWDDTFDARATETGKVASTLPIFSPQTVTYTEQAIAQYRDIVAQGGWPQVPATKKLQLGVSDADVAVLRKRLMVSGDLSASAGLSESFDSYVDSALKRFQTRHGLPADGVTGKYTFAAMNVSAQVRLGQLETNLVRLRSMGGFLGNRYVMVNIPAAQIEAVEGDRVVLRHTAIVGKIDRQTPIVNSKINEIIVNPYWNAPVSIVRKDIIPLMRKNPNYLKDSHIRLLAPDGSEVDPTTVDWSTEEAAKYRFRQDPGTGNAMASVKINFPSPDGVYMHDTPQKAFFQRDMRALSHGCVRLQDPRGMAAAVLDTSVDYIADKLAQGHSSQQVTRKIPVYVAYFTAWPDMSGKVEYFDDVYGRDDRLRQALEAVAAVRSPSS